MKTSISIWALVLFAGVAAHGSIVLSDSFTYPDGDVAIAPGSPWTVHSGTAPVNVTNGQVQINFNNSADVSAPLSGSPYDTTNNPSVTALYASFKASFITLPSTEAPLVSA